MSTVEGYKTTPRNPDFKEGDYLCDRDDGLTFKRINAPCPYCRRPMWALDAKGLRRAGTIGRIVKSLGREAICQSLPKELRVVHCSKCQQRFTVPAKSLRISKGGAVRRTGRDG